MAGRTLAFTFLGEDKSLGKTMKGVGRETKALRKSWGMLAGAFAGAAVGAKAVSFLKDAVSEAQEARKVSALTAQVIKTTGGAAKITTKQVGDLAEAISNKTGIDDEAIQSASNLLLTFTNVRNEVGKGNDIFNQATQISADMGVALGKDAAGSAIQLGKALNDPIKGVTALSKVGVSFTEQQKKQIKTLVESGKTLDAQKIILKELGREFGGAAEAAATPSQKLGVAWGNLKEQVGTALLPQIDKFANLLRTDIVPALSGFVSGMSDGTGSGGKFADVVGELANKGQAAWGAVKPLFTFIGDHPKLFSTVAVGAAGLALSLKTIGAAKGAVAVLKGLRGGPMGAAGAKAGVVPVFVTNPGFGGAGGKGAPVAGGKAGGGKLAGGKAALGAAGTAGAVIGAVAAEKWASKKLTSESRARQTNAAIAKTPAQVQAIVDALDEAYKRAKAALPKSGKDRVVGLSTLQGPSGLGNVQVAKNGGNTIQDPVKAYEFLKKYGDQSKKTQQALQALSRDPSVRRYMADVSTRSKQASGSLSAAAGIAKGLAYTLAHLPTMKNITLGITTQVDPLGRKIINQTGLGTSYVQGRGGKLVVGASGGIVRRPTMALIGEAGPEAVVPLDRTAGNSPLGTGGGYAGPSVVQLVVDRKVLAEVVRDQFGDWQRKGKDLGFT